MSTFSRRDVSAGGASLAIALSGAASATNAATAQEISRSSAAIHQEIDFAASPARLYRTLTVADEFDKVVRLSAAENSSMKSKLGSAPTAIDARPGGAFSLFGGYVTGFNLALVPDALIVQAWRSASWDAGQYSIAHFALVERGAGTRLLFDHKGFPDAAAEHLAQGWHVNYWEPLAKILS